MDLNGLEPGREKMISSHAGKLYQVKDASVFLGILYALSFLIMLPVYIKYFDASPALIAVSVLAFLCIVLVHLLFNWIYYVVISLPLLMSVLFFTLGWALYIFSPLTAALVSITLEAVTSLISVFVKSSVIPLSWLSYFNAFLEHLGQFFIAIGAMMWWLVQKGGQIRFKALAIYLVFLAVLGAMFGIGGLQNVIFFLVVWLLLYLKVSNEYLNAGLMDGKDLAGIKCLFKIAATVIIFSGITGVHIVGEGINAIMVFSYKGSNSAFYKAYQDIVLAFLLLGVWKPVLYKKWLPKQIMQKVENIWTLLKNKSDFIKL